MPTKSNTFRSSLVVAHQGAACMATHNTTLEYTDMASICLRQVGSNQTLLRIVHEPGPIVEVFFSYETPVAGWSSHQGYMQSEKHYSRTTAKHIALWLHSHNAKAAIVPQATINALLG